MRVNHLGVCLAFSALVQAVSVEVMVGLRQRNLQELEKLFWAVSTPGSSDYLKFRSVNELSELIAPGDKEVSQVKHWLAESGADGDSIRVSPLGDVIYASFTQRNLSTPRINGLLSKVGRPSSVEFAISRPDASNGKHDVTMALGASLEFGIGGYTVENIKKAYGIPVDLQASNASSLQMVWGPGTFGYSPGQLSSFKKSQCPLLNTDKVKFDTKNHGHIGDNYMEGNLDVQMISSFGLNVETLVSNTNTSSSTEEGEGFGEALLDFVTELPSRSVLPQVLSISLGSLSAYSCDLLVSEGVKAGFSKRDVQQFLQSQRQVCMFLSRDQVRRINTGFQLLGVRGVSVFGSSGDGGSHFSFQPFAGGALADALNKVSCTFQMPVFPTTSPYITSVGGTAWSGIFSKDSSKPKAWSGSGGGFSWEFGAATHQKDAVTAYFKKVDKLPPGSSFNSSGRAYPDISAIAVEGTSQSSPMVAGIFSLVNDHRLSSGLPPLGFLGPRLYKVMQNFPGEAFESVNSGNTRTSCDNGFAAADGWDPVTGWGRPRWQGLLKHFGSDSESVAPVVV